MSDTAIAPAAAPSPSPAAAEVAPIAAPVAAEASPKLPTAEEAMAGLDIGKLSSKEIDSLFAAEGARPAAPKVAAKADEAPPEQFSSHEEPGQKLKAALAAKTPEELAAAGNELRRISLGSMPAKERALTVQALDRIRAGMSPADAFAEAFGIVAKPAEAPAPTQAAPAVPAATIDPPVVQVHPKVATLEASLADLQAKYQEAKLAYDPAKDDLLEQMTDVKMDLRDARREAEIEAQRAAIAAEQEQAFQAAQAIHHENAMNMFADLITDPESGFVQHCDDELLLAQHKNDPILLKPDWQEKLGQRVKDKFFSGKAAKSAEPAPSVSQMAPPAPRQAVRLPGSPVGTGFAAGGLSQETAMVEFANLPDSMQIEALMKLDKAAATRRP